MKNLELVKEMLNGNKTKNRTKAIEFLNDFTKNYEEFMDENFDNDYEISNEDGVKTIGIKTNVEFRNKIYFVIGELHNLQYWKNSKDGFFYGIWTGFQIGPYRFTQIKGKEFWDAINDIIKFIEVNEIV